MKRGDLVWYKLTHKHKFFGVICGVGDESAFRDDRELRADVFVTHMHCSAKNSQYCRGADHIKGPIRIIIKIKKLRLISDLVDKNKVLENLLKEMK